MIDAHTGRTAGASTDILVIGDGAVGLSIALELHRAGAKCLVVGARRTGVASTTAGGLLAPSVGRVADPAQAFYEASLALYPAFVESLRDWAPDLRMTTGLLVLNRDGALPDSAARPLSAAELREIEPDLVAPNGAAMYPADGAIDNEQLTAALRIAATALIGAGCLLDDAVASLDFRSAGPVATTERGARIEARTVVLAAGAWVSRIAGLPRAIPVEPVKGQMIALSASPLSHAVVGNGVYVVPRGNETLVGSTLERTGYETSTDPATVDRLRASAVSLCPALADARGVRDWAGLRPCTPDMLPILGRDPAHHAVVYACGHSKNGILLAPATAKAIGAIVAQTPAPYDLTPFSIARFAGN